VGKNTGGRKKRSSPGETVDKAVGRAREAAGAVASDEILEAEGRTERRRLESNADSVEGQPAGDGGSIARGLGPRVFTRRKRRP
jgi:uncharacterized protein YjbJ (UPF0337 family)